MSGTTQKIAPASPEAQWNETWRRLDNLERLVFLGNGQPSVIAQLAEVRRAQQTQTWLTRTILGVVASNLVALVFLSAKLVIARGA